MSAHAVVSLPGSPYEGLEVDYHPTGNLATGPVWRCVWRAAMNGGSGAWVFVGGASLISTQSAVSDHTTANVNTWAALTNTPQITVSAGVYNISAHGGVQNLGSSIGWGGVRLRLNGSATGPLMASGIYTNVDGLDATVGRDVNQTFASATTITLAVATNNKSMRFGGGVYDSQRALFSLVVQPVEIRP